jgi:hypothetical protein
MMPEVNFFIAILVSMADSGRVTGGTGKFHYE